MRPALPIDLVLDDAPRAALAAAMRHRRTLHVAWISWPAQAVLSRALNAVDERLQVWVTDGPRTLDLLVQAMHAFADGDADRMACFPAQETTGTRIPDARLAGERLLALKRLREGRLAVLATCVQALLQPTLPPGDLDRTRRQVRSGSAGDPEELAALLQQAGYRFEPEVSEKGIAARRGGIVDVWPPDAEWPYRIEFFGTDVDSIRQFDPAVQRSIRRVDAVDLPPAFESRDSGASLLDYLPAEAAWIWADPSRIEEHARRFETSPDAGGAVSHDDVLARLSASPHPQFRLVPPEEQLPDTLDLGWKPLEGWSASPSDDAGGLAEPDALERRRLDFVRGLTSQAGPGRAVLFVFGTPGARDRFREVFGVAPTPAIQLRLGAIEEGFTAGPRFTVVAESDLYGRRRELRERHERLAARAAAKAAEAGPRLTDVSQLVPGDLVVHVQHGIGRYLGIYEIEFTGRVEESLAVEYANGAKLYIPVSQTHLLSKYVGVGGQKPELHPLGGGRWQKEKSAAERAIRDMAAQLIETQATRETQEGHAYPADGPWQREFEASFPYEETEDQWRAIEETKRDLENPQPMDRLVCGDVGYGKTEVAMRAAFKVVMGGKQVAVLVPTTVLAQQHYDTFRERMAPYPVSIEMLSRFRTRAEQDHVVRRLRGGGVDIVIGTHRLVQPDVSFKDLGLVVIDEEQRFGVAHKEALKQIRRTVDVLTMTATPIPRTLYLSLTGARDMSVIQTPPRARLPIETRVVPYDEDLVRDAIRQELNREGQVYYLHNRVQTIHHVRDRLVRLVPEARVAVAHGQMPERELADIMHRFVRGDADVLLCTTIIESGVDIPNVNTILIDRADRFGLAELYQLRGRVGRYKHRAFAYLMLPRHGKLFDTARRRLGAIRTYSSLGAGFKLALRDLEMRGAGNLLGSEQSGHIAAVGFDLYCQMLRRTVAVLKGETPPPLVETRVRLDFLDTAPERASAPDAAAIPYDYIEDEDQRLEVYRKIAGAATDEDVRQLQDDLRDRFGARPPSVDRLLKIARLRIAATRLGIDDIENRGEKLVLTRRGEPVTFDGKLPRLHGLTADRKLEETLRILQKLRG